MGSLKRTLALALAGVLAGSQIATVSASGIGGLTTVTGNESVYGQEAGTISGGEQATVTSGDGEQAGEEIKGPLAAFFSSLFGWNTKATAVASSVDGVRHSYTMKDTEKPPFLEVCRLSVQNQTGGYGKGEEPAPIALRFQMFVDDSYMETKLEEFQETPGFPVPGSDYDQFARDVDQWLLANHSGELEFAYVLPPELISNESSELKQGRDYPIVTDDGQDNLGTFRLEPAVREGSSCLEMKVSLSAVLYNRYETEMNFGGELQVETKDFADGDRMEADVKEGRIVFATVASAGGAGNPDASRPGYTVEKTAPFKTDTPYIDYRIQVDGTASTAAPGGTDNGKYLGGTTLTDILPVCQGSPLAVEELSYTYTAADGVYKSVTVAEAADGYQLDRGSLLLTFPDEMNDVLSATVSLRLALTPEQYKAYKDTGINEMITNTAVVRDAAGKDLSEAGEAQTRMEWKLFSKSGSQDTVNGRNFNWTLELNTKFNHAGYAYVIDSVNYDVHGYLIDDSHPLRMTVDREDGSKETIAYGAGQVADMTAQIQEMIGAGTLPGALAYGDYGNGDVIAGAVLPYLEKLGLDKAAKPFTYRYTENTGAGDTQKQLLIIPYKVIDTPGGPSAGETNVTDLTNASVTIGYATELNLEKWHGDVNAYLNDTGKTAVNAENDAKFIYDKYYYGKGPVGIDIGQVSMKKDVNATPVYVEKSGVRYDAGIHQARWRFLVNRYGAELKNLKITDELSTQGMTLVAVSMRRIDLDGRTAGSVTDMGTADPGDGSPYYTWDGSVLEIHMPSVDSRTSYEIWVDTTLTDQTKLAAQGTVTLKNKAKVEGTDGTVPIVNPEPEGSLNTPNQWVEKKAEGSFDYTNRSFTWEVTVNPNFLTLYEGVLTDELPSVRNFNDTASCYFGYGELTGMKMVTLENGVEKTQEIPVDGQAAGSISWTADGAAREMKIEYKQTDHKLLFSFPQPVAEKYILTFTTPISPLDMKAWLEGRSNTDTENVKNPVKLTGKVAGESGSPSADITSLSGSGIVNYAYDSDVNILKANLADKSGKYNDDGTITWTVLLNRHGVDLSGMTIVEDLTEALAAGEELNHELLEDSLKVYEGNVAADGKITWKPENLIDEAALHMTKHVADSAYEAGDGKAHGVYEGTNYGFELAVQAGDSYKDKPLVLVFDTVITKDGTAPSSLRNAIRLKSGSGNFQESSEGDGGAEQQADLRKFARTSRRPLLQVYKCSVNSDSLGLSGAEFALHEVTAAATGNSTVAGAVAKKGRSQADGSVYFMNLKEDMLYQIEEKTAPEGYKAADPQYVVFVRNKAAADFPDTITVAGTGPATGTNVTGDVTKIVWDAAAEEYHYPNADNSRIVFRDDTLDTAALNKITFLKKQADGVAALSGAEFKLERLKTDGSVDSGWGNADLTGGGRGMTAVSGADGLVTFTNVDPGKYRITEQTIGDGWWQKGGVIELEVKYSAAGSAGYTYELKLPAQEKRLTLLATPGAAASYTVADHYITGKAKLTKKDIADGGEIPLAGAEYTVYLKTDYEAYKSSHSNSDAGIGENTGDGAGQIKAVASGTTRADGTLELTGLTYNTEYAVVETKAPKGYRLEADKPISIGTTDYANTSACIIDNPNQSFVLTLPEQTNERRLGTISFDKKDSYTGLGGAKPLPDRKFLLVCRDAKLNGVASNSYFTMSVTGAGGGWQYGDVSAWEPEITGNVYYQLKQSGVDGKVSFKNVPYSGIANAYQVVELPATSGAIGTAASRDVYDVSAAKWSITLSGLNAPAYTETGDAFTCYGGPNGKADFANSLKKTDLTLTKVSGAEGISGIFENDIIKGTVFELSMEDYDGNILVKSSETDVNGKVTFENIPMPSGDSSKAFYTLTETGNAQLPGYAANTSYHVTLKLDADGHAQIADILAVAPADQDLVEKVKDNEYKIANRPYSGTLVLHKQSEVKTGSLAALADKPLGGVTFKLYGVKQDGTRTHIQDAVSSTAPGTAGEIRFENIPFGQAYEVEEVVPVGYQAEDIRGSWVVGDGVKTAVVLSITPKPDNTEGWTYDAAAKSFVYDGTGALTNRLVQKSLKLTKTDQEGNPLEGRRFDLYRRDTAAAGADGAGMTVNPGAAVNTFYPYGPLLSVTTGADGVVTLDHLPYGDYLAVEDLSGQDVKSACYELWISVDAGEIRIYENDTLKSGQAGAVYTPAAPGASSSHWETVTVESPAAGGYETATLVNQLKFGFLDFTKVSAEEGTGGKLVRTGYAMPLAGAVFEIYQARQQDGAYHKLSATPYLTLRTDADGHLQAVEDTASSDYGMYQDVDGSKKRLLYGDYILVEKTAPDGYGVDDREIGFTVEAQGTRLKLPANMTDAAGSGQAAAGEFGNARLRCGITLYKKDADSHLNGAQKNAVFEVLREEGGAETLVATLRYDESQDVAQQQSQGYRYLLSDLALDGAARLNVLDGEGQQILYDDGDGFKLLPGSYQIQEVKAPDGYEVRDRFQAVITITGGKARVTGVSGNLEAGLEADGSVSLTEDAIVLKVEKRSGEGDTLTGARFTVTGAFRDAPAVSNAVKTLEEADEGQLIAGNVYLLSETQAPDGYRRYQGSVPFTVTAKGEIELYPGSAPAADNPALVENGAKDTIVFTDKPVELGFAKTDMDQNPIDIKYGEAKFEITGVFAGSIGGAEETVEVAADGRSSALLKGRLIAGNTYRVNETAVPEGYRKAPELRFLVKDDGTVELTALQDQMSYDSETGLLTVRDIATCITIQKQGAGADGRTAGLAGAQFTLTPQGSSHFAGGSAQALSLVTDADGRIKLDGILMAGGTYLLTENKAAQGYQTPVVGGDSFLFTVPSDGNGLTELANSLRAQWKDQEETLVVENTKTELLIEKKDDSETHDRVEGATLRIYPWDVAAQAAGSPVREFITDKDGERITYLEEGTYVLKETGRPGGYRKAQDIYFELKPGNVAGLILADGTSVADNTILSLTGSGIPCITMTDKIVRGRLTVVKYYRDTDTPVSGLAFTLYDRAGNPVETLVTGNDGRVSWTELAEGTYILRENFEESLKHGVPGEVHVDEETEYSVEIRVAADGVTVSTVFNGEILTEPDQPVRVENERMNASVVLQKYDAVNKDGLGDTEFTLEYRNDAAEPWKPFGARGVYTTDEQGILKLGSLIRGEYRLTETHAHRAYELETEPFQAQFTVTNAEHGQTLTINSESVRDKSWELSADGTDLLAGDGLGNRRKAGQVTLLKTDARTGEGLDGVEYTLYRKEKAENLFAGLWNFLTGKSYHTVDNLEGTQLAENGRLTISGLEWGSYMLTETKALPGYRLNPAKYTFVIGPDGTDYTFLYENQELRNVKNSFSILKTDKEGNKLAGAVFTVLEKDSGIVIWEGAVDGSKELTGLLTGGRTYVLRETAAPEGYEKAPDVVFTMTETGEVIIGENQEAVPDNVIQVKDERIEVKLHKTSTANSDYRLEDARYRLCDVTQGTQDGMQDTVVLTSAAEGILLPGLAQGHTYTLEEIEAPEGYLLPGEDGILTFRVLEDGTVSFEENAVFGGAGTDTITASDDPVRLRVTKNSPEGIHLMGCVFRVSGSFAPLPQGAVLPENGGGAKAAGAPAAASVANAVNTSASASVLAKAAQESPQTGEKADKDGNAGPDQQEYLIVDDAHQDVLEGRLIVGNTYTVQEMTAPDGYKVGGAVDFTVQKDGSIKMKNTHEYTLDENGVIVMVDQPYILHIIKADEQSAPLAGAEFVLEGLFADGSTSVQIKPDETGFEFSAMMSGGQEYVLAETKAPEGYEKAEQTLVISVDFDGKMVVISGNDQGLASMEETDGVSRLTIRNRKLEQSPGGAEEEAPKEPGKEEVQEEGSGENSLSGGAATGDRTKILPAAGCLLLGAGIVLLTRKRRDKGKR